MHNNDLSKDDFLEAFLAILERMKDFFFKRNKEEKDQQIKAKNEDELIDKFKEIIQYIREKELGKDVEKILDYMEENPKEAMELITNAVKNALENKKEELKQSNEELKQINIENNKLVPDSLKEELLKLKEEYNRKIDNIIDTLENENHKEQEQIINQKENKDEKSKEPKERDDKFREKQEYLSNEDIKSEQSKEENNELENIGIER